MIVGERPIAVRKAIPQSGRGARLLDDTRSALPLFGQEVGEERLHDPGEIAGNASNLLNEVLAEREIDRTLTCRTGGATHHVDTFWIANAHYMRTAQAPQRQARKLWFSHIRPNPRYVEVRIVAPQEELLADCTCSGLRLGFGCKPSRHSKVLTTRALCRTMSYPARSKGRHLRILANPAPATISQAYASAAPP